MTPQLEFVFEARIDLAPALEVGKIDSGAERRVIPILGGTFEGPAIKGMVLSGGADWQIVRADGTAELDVRYTFQTDSGALICVFNRGLRTGTREVLAKLRAGESVASSDYYFRSAPRFETGDAKLQWLCRSIFVASGERLASQVILRVWRVC